MHHQDEIVKLNPEIDLPDGLVVTDSVFDRLQDLRINKMKSEIGIKKETMILNDLKHHLDHLQKQVSLWLNYLIHIFT